MVQQVQLGLMEQLEMLESQDFLEIMGHKVLPVWLDYRAPQEHLVHQELQVLLGHRDLREALDLVDLLVPLGLQEL